MATPIPFQPYPDMVPADIASGPISVPAATAEAFGAPAARAAQTLGQGVQQAADAGIDAATARQTLTNEIHASEDNTWLTNKVTDRFEQFNKLEGKAAQEALPQFKADVDDLYQQHIEAAGNLQTKAMLAKTGRNIADSYYRYATNYADGQWRTWQAKTSADRAATYGNQAAIALTNGDQQGMDIALHTSDDEVAKMFEARGYDRATIDAEVAKNRGKNLKTIIDMKADEDPQAAQDLFRKYQGGMDAQSQLAVMNKLRSSIMQGKAAEAGEAALGRAPAPSFDGKINGALSLVSGETGVPETTLRTFAKIETGGDPTAVKGSYKGLFQLGPEEWAKYGQGDIFNPVDNARAEARKIHAESQAFQQKFGRAPSVGDLYLVHQQGAGGYAAHMANPDAPAWQNMASTAEGRQKGEAWAKAAIWGNIPDQVKKQFPGGVESVTSRDFTNYWQGRVGGMTGGPLPDKGEAYDRAISMTQGNPALQNATLAYVNKQYSIYHAATQLDMQGFKGRVQDSQVQASRDGVARDPIALDQFTSRLGLENGAAAYSQYQQNLQFSTDVHEISAVSPEEADALQEKYKPQPGEGYAEQSKMYDGFIAARKAVDEEKRKDAASFALNRLPAAQAAYHSFNDVLSKAGATADDRTKAAELFASVTLAEQARVGVPPAQRRVVPQGFIDNLQAALSNPDAAGGAPNVLAQLEAQHNLWGTAWPEIQRQIQEKAEPLVRVISAGVEPRAGQLLINANGVKEVDLLKQQDAETQQHVRKSVIDELKPFRASLSGSEADQTFNAYQNMSERLAAIYVGKGATAADAAKLAVTGLLNFKYTYAPDGFRVPKFGPDGKTPVSFSADDIQMGATEAKENLGELGLMPALGDGFRLQYRHEASTSALRRDGKWLTAPDDDGLLLGYKDEPALGKDGQPFILKWADLARLGERARQTAMVPGQYDITQVPPPKGVWVNKP